MCLVAAIVSVALCGAFTGPARADDLTEAQETLTRAEERLAQLSAEAETLRADIDALQVEIDETLARVHEAQSAMIEGQAKLGRSVAYSYKTGNMGFIDILLSSGSISELFQNLDYMHAIQKSQADEIEAQKARKAEYDSALADLNAKKDAQQAKLKELENAQAEARNVVEAAAAKVSKIQDEREAERLQALKDQADAMVPPAPQAPENPGTDDNWNTNPGGEGKPGGNGDGGGSDAGGNGDNGNGGGSDNGSGNGSEVTPPPVDPGTGWQTGVASAYGGSTDPWTPNPGTTATGAVCDDNSIGVAIPMSWPKYWTYYGRSVEITYGGKTVIAVVNDCGYMGGGSRVLDLQPGVWKQFGFSSCREWGLRTVSYRFI